MPHRPRVVGIVILAFPCLYILHLVLLRIYGYVLLGPGSEYFTLLQDSFVKSAKAPVAYDSERGFNFFPPPDVEHRAPGDIDNTFRDYKHAAECGVSSQQLHLPFEPLCKDKDSVLAAMSNGGRAGFDAPYIPAACDMRWYESHELCAIFDKYSKVFILGDSIQRHLTNALWILLRGDIGSGGVTDWQIDLSDDHENISSAQDCLCHKQFISHTCSNSAIQSYDWVRGNASNTLVCEDLSQDFDLRYHQLRSFPLDSLDLDEIVAQLPEETPEKPVAFIMHHALWNNVDLDATMHWIDQILDHIRLARPWLDQTGVFPRLYVTANSGGITKALGFVVAQGQQALAKFEKDIEAHLRFRDIDFLGMYNMSIQSTQPDGSHSNLETNLIKAQMVLNWLDYLDVTAYDPYEN